MINKEKGQQFGEDAINKMLEIAGHEVRFNDIEKMENWFQIYTCNEKQENEFKLWFINEYSKRFRVNKHKGLFSADRNFISFLLNYGLKRNDI